MRDYRVKACETEECLVRLVPITQGEISREGTQHSGDKAESQCGKTVSGSEGSWILDVAAALTQPYLTHVEMTV